MSETIALYVFVFFVLLALAVMIAWGISLTDAPTSVLALASQQ
ncbi:MAG: hypothetical protein ACREI2_05675 [Nitrospiraceae bacterium]